MARDGYPQRIVCLTEEPTEVLYALGEQDRIVGISGFTVRPPRARKEKPKVSAFTSAKIGEILKLEPDLAIGFSDIQADIARALAVKPATVTNMLQRMEASGLIKRAAHPGRLRANTVSLTGEGLTQDFDGFLEFPRITQDRPV